MLRVVVVGGTGFIGRRLIHRLVEKGHDVLLLARDVSAARERFAAEPAVRVSGWTLETGAIRQGWESEVSSADAVVNLAGAGIMDAPWTEARKKELYGSRLDVTRALAETLAKAPARREREPAARAVFVSASAVGIYGMRKDGTELTEESPAGQDMLADICVQWERAASPARDAGVRVVHPRFGIVLGNDGGALPETVRPFKLHAGGPLGSGDQWVSWVHEDDVVGALMLALESSALEGAYNVVAPHPVTAQDEARAIAKVLHTHALARVPAFALKLILGSERAEVVLTGQRASARRLTDAGYTFAFPELVPALEDLLTRR